MRLARILLCFGVVAAGWQEEPLRVRAVTKDGHSYMGHVSLTTVKLDSSLGELDLALKDLTQIRFEGETVSVTGRDATTVKGKVVLDQLTVQSRLGEILIKREALASIEVPGGTAVPWNPPASKDRPAQVILRMIDGNDLQGTVESGAMTCETSQGTFKFDVTNVIYFMRGNDKQPHTLSLQDGTLLRSAPAVSDMKVRTSLGEFQIKAEKVQTLSCMGLVNSSPGRGRNRNPNEPPVPAKPTVLPIATRSLQAVLGNVVISMDGAKAYAVNQSEGKLYCWSVPDLAPVGSVALSASEKTIDLLPDETGIVAVGEKTVSVLDVNPLKIQSSFSVEVTLEDVSSLNQDQIAATGPNSTVVISLKKTAIVQNMNGWASSRLVIHPQGDKMYLSGGLVSLEPTPEGIRLVSLQLPHRAGNVGMINAISRDGRYASTPSGTYRLGRCWEAAQLLAGSLERHSATAFSHDSNTLYVFTGEGFLKVFDTKHFKLQSSHYLGICVLQASSLPDGKSLLVAGLPPDANSSTQHYHAGNPHKFLCNLYRFEIPK